MSSSTSHRSISPQARSDAHLLALLTQGVTDLSLTLPQETLELLLRYQAQLALWNQAYNLTAVRTPQEMVIRHLLDCLSVVPYMQAGRLLDVGTGAGLPGLILAMVQPERPCVLLDSNGKKIRFIRQVVADLNIQNAQPVHARVESAQTLAQLGQFDVITSRAFTALPAFVQQVTPYLAEGGQIAAMKAIVPTAEIQDLGAGWDVEVQALHVPMLNEQRHVLSIRQHVLG